LAEGPKRAYGVATAWEHRQVPAEMQRASEGEWSSMWCVVRRGAGGTPDGRSELDVATARIKGVLRRGVTWVDWVVWVDWRGWTWTGGAGVLGVLGVVAA
jgi:hypothetical protein